MPKRRRGSGPGIGRKRWIQRPGNHETPQKVDSGTPKIPTHGKTPQTPTTETPHTLRTQHTASCRSKIAEYGGYIVSLEQMSFTAEVDHIRHIKKQYVQKYFIELKKYWTNTLKRYKVKQIHTIANEVAADKVIGGLPPKGKLAN